MGCAGVNALPVSRAWVSSSGALACSVALRLAAPRRLAAALAPAAPSEDILTLLPTEIRDDATRSAARRAHRLVPRAVARRAKLGVPAQTCRASADACGTKDRNPAAPPTAIAACAHGRTEAKLRALLRSQAGRRGMSSEGAAGASAAARPRGAASRKAKRQARAPKEDIPRRPRAMHQEKARTTKPDRPSWQLAAER
jgi:hypothetical protein